eukprot:6248055-Amphidinium_carterae.3
MRHASAVVSDPATAHKHHRVHGKGEHACRSERSVQRDVLPLPMSCLDASDELSGKRRRGVTHYARRVAGVLNEMVGCAATDGVYNPSVHAGAAQHILQECSQALPFSRVDSPREAFCALLKLDQAYAGALASCTVKPYQAELLSVPSSGTNAPTVESMLDPVGQNMVEDFQTNMLATPEELAHVVDTEGLLIPYMDPVLRQNYSVYELFVETLFNAGMLDFATAEGVTEIVTPVSNRRFKPPLGMKMCTGEVFSEIQLALDEMLWGGLSDISNFFDWLSTAGAWGFRSSKAIMSSGLCFAFAGQNVVSSSQSGSNGMVVGAVVGPSRTYASASIGSRNRCLDLCEIDYEKSQLQE